MKSVHLNGPRLCSAPLREERGEVKRRLASCLDPQFQTATRLRSRAAARGELLVCLPFCEGRRSAERRIVNRPRLISRIAGKQHHTATPPGAPPRRLKTLVRSSGDLATLGDFAPHACPRPASSQWQSPVVGPDGNPGPPEPVLARHNLRRRIRPAWVTPPRPSLKLCPTSGSPLEAPPHWTGQGNIYSRLGIDQ